MFKNLFGGEKTVEQFDPNVSRDEIIRRGRILVIDDERPVIIDSLQRAGFSVDYDKTGIEINKVENQVYDLVLLDFGGVGHHFGPEEGLELLRHIKRTAPGTRVLAFTSKALQSNQSDFFRLADDVLRKDAGLQESMEIIEDQLKESFRIRNLWNAVLELSGIRPNSTKAEELSKVLIKAIEKRNSRLVLEALSKKVGKSVEKAAEIGLKKLFAAAGIAWK